MNLAHVLLQQCRQPSGWLGGLVARNMNQRHSALTDWGLTGIDVAADASVLDVGCGGGRTLQKLAARVPRGRAWGVDFAPASVVTARRVNRGGVAAGRVAIARAGVSHLPFADGTFDLVTAVETHYYWPDLPADVREVHRVTRPGGTFVLVAEAYRTEAHARIARYSDRLEEILGFKLLTAEEHRELLVQAGFAGVQVDEQRGRAWIRALGRRSADAP